MHADITISIYIMVIQDDTVYLNTKMMLWNYMFTNTCGIFSIYVMVYGHSCYGFMYEDIIISIHVMVIQDDTVYLMML